MPSLFDDDDLTSELNGPNVEPEAPAGGFMALASVAIHRSHLELSDWWRKQVGKDWLANRLQIEIARVCAEAYRCGQQGISLDATVEESPRVICTACGEQKAFPSYNPCVACRLRAGADKVRASRTKE